MLLLYVVVICCACCCCVSGGASGGGVSVPEVMPRRLQLPGGADDGGSLGDLRQVSNDIVEGSEMRGG